MSTKNFSPYVPSFLKASLFDSRPQQLTFADLLGVNNDVTNVNSTSSFKYDPLDSPLKNTQQLNIDWSKFENHTFFSSAEVKVNTTFDQIINGYPFDGTKKEVEHFFERLGGFEKWVFDQFPKFGGQLHFSGTQVGEDPSNGFDEQLGTWIDVKDSAGWLYPEISKNSTGESLLNPLPDKSFTIEAQIFLPDQPNDCQVLIQKKSEDSSQGFTLHIEPSLSSKVVSKFSISSGGVGNFVSAELKKGEFNHVCVSLNRDSGNNFLQFYVNESLVSESKKEKNIGLLDDKSNLRIGSGSSFYVENLLVTPTQTFSGTLDELRVFHSTRTKLQQQLYASKGLYSNESLKLYFRFNEPNVKLSSDINDSVNSIVLDSSGNSLHSSIKNFSLSLRQSSEADTLSKMKNEKDVFKTVLFPYHPEIVDLNLRLLSSASVYDDANPNLITKLIPRHYLRDGALEEGFSSTAINGSIGDSYGGEGIPGQGKLGSVQIILSFLYIWAKLFDEIKMFVDAFRTLRSVEYYLDDTIPDNFLGDFVRAYGFYLPPFFNSSNLTQYVEGEDINEVGISNLSLKNVQTQLLRRVLINLPDVIRSKGTQHSIRSFLRSVGIDPDNTMRIREFGGPSIRELGSCREYRSEPIPVVDFLTSSIVTTPFLSCSRVEPGFPNISGVFVNGISNSKNDGLLTSGSWTYEGLYKFGAKNVARSNLEAQSLARFEATGSSSTSGPALLLNLVASSSLYAFIRPGASTNSPVLKLELDVDVRDGRRWNISTGCRRNDSMNSAVSSSYFLRAATQSAGEITDIFVTSSFFKEEYSSEGNSFRKLDPLLNASGSRISIGNNENIPEGGIGYLFLNSTLDSEDLARTHRFSGQANNIRFWSEFLSEEEWKEHVRNYRSVGVDNPFINYNFVKNVSGSFEKLRLSILEKQSSQTADDNGEISFLDFSKNGFMSSGSGFLPKQKVVIGDLIDYSYISPYFDEYSSSEKIRVRSFQEEKNLKNEAWARLAPVYDIPAGETPLDDPRLSIEFSLVDSLNKDIINMFAGMDSISNATGDPALMFSPDYPDLERLRDIYFNRLSEKLNFRSFLEFYRWFDVSISTIIAQLVPRKTRFKGTNYVIESHMLERHKIEYQSSEIYLGDTTRSRIRDVLLVQQVVGNIVRY